MQCLLATPYGNWIPCAPGQTCMGCSGSATKKPWWSRRISIRARGARPTDLWTRQGPRKSGPICGLKTEFKYVFSGRETLLVVQQPTHLGERCSHSCGGRARSSIIQGPIILTPKGEHLVSGGYTRTKYLLS